MPIDERIRYPYNELVDVEMTVQNEETVSLDFCNAGNQPLRA
jgi:hypothetical protein